jgi:hypothetical protein
MKNRLRYVSISLRIAGSNTWVVILCNDFKLSISYAAETQYYSSGIPLDVKINASNYSGRASRLARTQLHTMCAQNPVANMALFIPSLFRNYIMLE